MKKLTKQDIPALYSDSPAEVVEVRAAYTAHVKVEVDDPGFIPWEEHDGHGVVSDWVNRDMKPGERTLCSKAHSYDEHRERYYDFAESINIALMDGWGSSRTTPGMTKRQRAVAAVEADYEYLRAWCNDEWQYVGVIVTLFHNGVEVASDSLWGVEPLDDYPRQVAAEMINDLVEQHIKDRVLAAVQAMKEHHEAALWAARGVVTLT